MEITMEQGVVHLFPEAFLSSSGRTAATRGAPPGLQQQKSKAKTRQAAVGGRQYLHGKCYFLLTHQG